MSESNPYSPPIATLREGNLSGESKLGLGQWVLMFLFFCVVSIVIWVVLILVLFGDSSASWPGFACAIPAIGGSIFLCRTKLMRRVLIRLQLTTVITLVAASFLLILAIEEQMNSQQSGEPLRLFPNAESTIAPAHYVLGFTSLMGTILGAISIATNCRRKSLITVIVTALFWLVCVSYVFMWILFLVEYRLVAGIALGADS